MRRDWKALTLAFHAKHPEVYTELVRLARQAKNEKGFRKLGVELIVNVYRWEHRGGICQNYARTYGRLIMQQEPDLAGFFNLRQRSAAKLAEDQGDLY